VSFRESWLSGFPPARWRVRVMMMIEKPTKSEEANKHEGTHSTLPFRRARPKPNKASRRPAIYYNTVAFESVTIIITSTVFIQP